MGGTNVFIGTIYVSLSGLGSGNDLSSSGLGSGNEILGMLCV